NQRWPRAPREAGSTPPGPGAPPGAPVPRASRGARGQQWSGMDTAFVIGGGGFVGRHLVRHLAAHGLRVLATCRPGAAAPTVPGVEWVPSDLAAADPARGWPRRYEAVIYLA